MPHVFEFPAAISANERRDNVDLRSAPDNRWNFVLEPYYLVFSFSVCVKSTNCLCMKFKRQTRFSSIYLFVLTLIFIIYHFFFLCREIVSNKYTRGVQIEQIGKSASVSGVILYEQATNFWYKLQGICEGECNLKCRRAWAFFDKLLPDRTS